MSESIALPDVTLCCVDSTPRLPWGVRALRESMERVSFGDVVLCTDRKSLGATELPPGVRWAEIAALDSIEAYSTFMIKELGTHVRTSHVLVVQWDGYVLEPKAWRSEFLEFDYIGAPWNHIPEPWQVGNGGFSLRSAKLLQALRDPQIQPAHPEDICICKTYRNELEARGIRFAPLGLAHKFAVEDDPLSGDVFGFHGPYHLPHILSPDEVHAFILSLEPSAVKAHYFGSLLRELDAATRERPAVALARQAFDRLVDRAVAEQFTGSASLTPQALGVLKALIRHGRIAPARVLLEARRVALGRGTAETKLWGRLQWQAVAQHWKGR